MERRRPSSAQDHKMRLLQLLLKLASFDQYNPIQILSCVISDNMGFFLSLSIIDDNLLNKMLFLSKLRQATKIAKSTKYLTTGSAFNFGLIRQYNERASKKLNNNHLIPDKPQFFVTSARPGNFGDHIDFKVTLDNWFDENRVHNEQETDIRRTQIYMLSAVYYAALANFARMYAVAVVGRLNGWTRYDRNTYLQVDISQIPPGQVLQIVWNGIPVFIRRLTAQEVHQETHQFPTETLLDKASQVCLNPAGNTHLLVCSAVCTHLGCVPIPYLGAYNGWVCICHGSVYDKFGRVRQGPALLNLPYINNSLYEDGTLLCIEEMKFPREPSVRFWT